MVPDPVYRRVPGKRKTALKSPRGTFDILPPESAEWARVEEKAREAFRIFNYSEIRTPVFEDTSLFTRSIGEGTDIVSGEMYNFRDRKGRSLTLRPEGTAPIVRAFIEHNMELSGGLVKLFYAGPFFRYERPQAGRNRQFYQLGAEAIGSDSPALDAEIINLAVFFLSSAGIGSLRLLLNTTGCPSCRGGYVEKLREHFKGESAGMCGDCRRRVDENPLRILDCKRETCSEARTRAPKIPEYVCAGCEEHFGEVKKYLGVSGQEFETDPFLVRGLDYYTRTTFEITHHGLGAQNALAGGGRFDCLVEELGGAPAPGAGFACGMERVVAAAGSESAAAAESAGPAVFACAAGAGCAERVFNLVRDLRRAGISCDMDYQGRPLKSQLRVAGRMNALYAVIVSGDYIIKNMETGRQEAVPAEEIVERFKRITKGAAR